MQYNREDPGATRVVTLDIETTHYEPSQGEVVSIGVAEHERGGSPDDVTYHLIHRDGAGEADTIQRGLGTMATANPELLVSFNGKSFDLDFLRQRMHRLGESVDRFEMPPMRHIDLFTDRQQKASRIGEKWPKLEECLESYGLTPATTRWKGQEVTNKRFGEELGPAYLRAVQDGAQESIRALEPVVDHYLTTDLEANLCLFYADIGEAFDPVHLGSERTFSAVSASD